MKTPPPFAALLLAFAVNLHAELQRPTKEELMQLIAAVPAGEELLRDNELVLHPEKAKSATELFEAKDRLTKAKIAIRDLQKLVTLGSRIFDYPGLLAQRRIYYSPGEYSFYLGAHLPDAEGQTQIHSDKTDRFNIVFNDDGIITVVNFRNRGSEQREKADVLLRIAHSDEIHLQRPEEADRPFSRADLAERISAATAKREMIVLTFSKAVWWHYDEAEKERLKQLADDFEKRLREIGFKK